eukprot:TRINITY_DN1060_c1_g1_i1.p1 TRINITY_DN1060_c1_g1~~TRINITY_DN1060_c1_g1_i1.p1  ORF type:complete len:222 (-),score=88.22 TRINITY_DN1060_c1_g1_i1:203-868(-)
MASYELVYWPNFSGRAEPIIFILNHFKADYIINNEVNEFIENNNRNDSSNNPVFACPIIKKNGTDVVIAQTVAIVRYLAKEFNFIPSGSDDEVLNTSLNTVDLWNEAYLARTRDADKGENFIENRTKKWAKIFEKILSNSNGDYLYGDLSYVDFLLFNVIRAVEFMHGKDGIEPFTSLENFGNWFNSMFNVDSIKTYFEGESYLPVVYPDVKFVDQENNNN